MKIKILTSFVFLICIFCNGSKITKKVALPQSVKTLLSYAVAIHDTNTIIELLGSCTSWLGVVCEKNIGAAFCKACAFNEPVVVEYLLNTHRISYDNISEALAFPILFGYTRIIKIIQNFLPIPLRNCTNDSIMNCILWKAFKELSIHDIKNMLEALSVFQFDKINENQIVELIYNDRSAIRKKSLLSRLLACYRPFTARHDNKSIDSHACNRKYFCCFEKIKRVPIDMHSARTWISHTINDVHDVNPSLFIYKKARFHPLIEYALYGNNKAVEEHIQVLKRTQRNGVLNAALAYAILISHNEKVISILLHHGASLRVHNPHIRHPDLGSTGQCIYYLLQNRKDHFASDFRLTSIHFEPLITHLLFLKKMLSPLQVPLQDIAPLILKCLGWNSSIVDLARSYFL